MAVCRSAAAGRRYSVYLLACADGSYYCGITTDIERRLKQHNAGKGGAYTRSRLPVKLVALGKRMTKSAALKREALVKKQPRRLKPAAVAHSGT